MLHDVDLAGRFFKNNSFSDKDKITHCLCKSRITMRHIYAFLSCKEKTRKGVVIKSRAVEALLCSLEEVLSRLCIL